MPSTAAMLPASLCVSRKTREPGNSSDSAASRRGHSFWPPRTMPDAAYIAVIGIPLSCRGKYRLPDGRRVGEFLLDDALEVVHRVWGGGSMPPVWALIAPANQASHDLFANRGFGHIPDGPHTDNHDIRLRGRALPLR